MSERTRQNPASLDALLSANRDSFDALFDRGMSGGQASRTPRAASHAPAAVAPATPSASGENATAELNRRYGMGWSAETLSSRIEDGRAITECRLTVGDQSWTDQGTARVGDDQDAAVQRAFDRALQACADQATRGAPTATRPAEQKSAPVDLITANRVETALTEICAEMDCVLARQAVSAMPHPGPVGRAMIADGAGRMIAGQFGSYIAHLLEMQKLHFAPGDAVLISDPYSSGGAASGGGQWLVLAPIYHGSDLIGFTSVNGQMADVGAAAPGGAPGMAHSVFAEGIRIPAVKICEGGTINDVGLNLILTNTRQPQVNRADLMAMLGACRAGAARVDALCARMGAEAFHQASAAILERTNAAMRHAIVASVPEEPQSFSDRIDDDGLGNGPFTLKMTVWREGEHAYFDWTGTSDQAPGPINVALHVGLAKMLAGRALMPDAVGNDGYYDLIHVTLPKGSVLNPTFPAALGQREHGLARVWEVMSSALDRHAPARLSAAGHGTRPTITIQAGGQTLSDTVFGGGPARPHKDGGDGKGMWRGQRTTPAERIEAGAPVRIEGAALVPDSGGAGRYRGGCAVEKVYSILAPGHVSISDDRAQSRPYGVAGGRPGTSSHKWIERADGGREALPAKADAIAVAAGDRIIFRTAGGGGYGNPLERPADQVRADVAQGLLTIDAASGEYGVILGAGLQVDQRATDELRTGLMRERNGTKLFDHGDPG